MEGWRRILKKLLYKTRNNNIIDGVCGGLANYFSMDPSIMRILFVGLAIPLNILMVVLYIALAIILPKESCNQMDAEGVSSESIINNVSYHTLIGGVLILVGGYVFFNRYVHWFDFGFMAPVILVLLGSLLIFTAQRKKEE